MPLPKPASDPTLRDHLGTLRRRAGTIVITVFLVVLVSLVLSILQSKVYRATAEVALQTRSTERIFDPTASQTADPVRLLNTEIRVIKSQLVRDAVIAQLGPVAKVSASPIAQTQVIGVSVEDKDPKRAADVANAYVNAYIGLKRTSQVDDVLAAVQQVQARVGDLQKEIDVAPEGLKESLIQQQSAFRQQLDQLQVAQALASGGVQLVNPAATPDSPVRPQPVRSGVVAGVMGLVLGIGLAFLFDHLDDSVKTKDDLERVTGGLPTLGLIPAVPGWRPRGEPLVISIAEPQSAVAEAYRTLRTGVQFVGLDQPTRSLQVTSSNPGEGKTTTLANLGVALARSGLRVVLVCCDLRRPRIHEFFGLENSIGLTSVLLGKVSLHGALQTITSQERLSLLASGPVPPNPSELLASARTSEVLTLLQKEADIVLLDSPPVLPVTDALILSNRVDATLLVCAAGSVTRKHLARSVELLNQVDARLVGTVLNGVSGEASYGYADGYEGYQKRADTPASSGKTKKRAASQKSSSSQASW